MLVNRAVYELCWICIIYVIGVTLGVTSRTCSQQTGSIAVRNSVWGAQALNCTLKECLHALGYALHTTKPVVATAYSHDP